MPNKKTQRRPNRQRNRTARPAPARETIEEEVLVGAAVPSAAVPAAPAASATATVARAVGTRRPQPPRRGAASVINYAYLRHDLTTLGILAPAMVILVILAFIFIH